MENPVQYPEEPARKDKSTSFAREILSTAGILVTALLTAFFIIAFVFRSYQVDGASMESTLQNTDKLIIWKIPRSWAKVTNHDYIPKRGDIIVFTQSGLSEYGQQDQKQLIKRVLGLPGDRVTVHDGVITIYNDEYPGGFNPDKTLDYGKKLPDNFTSGNKDLTLADNQLFVVGDNRAESLDSRVFGPIKAQQVVGKLVLRVFPLSNAEAF